jgi:hypothetical protein
MVTMWMAKGRGDGKREKQGGMRVDGSENVHKRPQTRYGRAKRLGVKGREANTIARCT